MRLLHSPHKDATAQLKTMLEDCYLQRKTNPQVAPPVHPKPLPSIKPLVVTKNSLTTTAVSVPITVPITASIATVPIKITQTNNPAPQASPTSIPGTLTSSCVVCKRGVRFGNELVECQDCHSLYHQACHKPNLTNENVKDPRFVWYCSNCTGKRKKIKLATTKQVAVSAFSGIASREGSSKEPQTTPGVSPFKTWSFKKEF